MKKSIFFFIISFIFLFGCNKDNPVDVGDQPVIADFAVFSDVHFYDVSLGTSGSAFESYLKQDRKLLAESEPILQSVITSLTSEKLDFILIPGDLTKDGELSGHQKAANYLRTLEAQGKKVYVVPGNHDINNQHALKFNGSSTEHVATITPDEFAQIYADFGYSEALERDPNSLSYTAEPVKGIILIAMDACRYKENGSDPITGGKFSAVTLDWILKKIKDAKSNNKLVFGMMHHGILEHFTGEKTIAGEYVLDDFQTVSRQFAEAGMSIIFTGHAHAQDIVSATFGNNYLYDIETGSLVTYPSPYRLINLSDKNIMTITSRHVESINYNTGGKTFQQYSKDFIQNGVEDIAANYLVNTFGMSSLTASVIAPYAASVFIANCQGDESPNSETKLVTQALNLSSDQSIRYVAQVLNAMWTDLPPKDNDLIINLNTGIATNPGLSKTYFIAKF
jgi:3',5'-cyclic AMP phosphodiesterase CpdA